MLIPWTPRVVMLTGNHVWTCSIAPPCWNVDVIIRWSTCRCEGYTQIQILSCFQRKDSSRPSFMQEKVSWDPCIPSTFASIPSFYLTSNREQHSPVRILMDRICYIIKCLLAFNLCRRSLSLSKLTFSVSASHISMRPLLDFEMTWPFA